MAFAKCLFFFFSLPFTKIHVLLKTKQQGKKKKEEPSSRQTYTHTNAKRKCCRIFIKAETNNSALFCLLSRWSIDGGPFSAFKFCGSAATKCDFSYHFADFFHAQKKKRKLPLLSFLHVFSTSSLWCDFSQGAFLRSSFFVFVGWWFW